MSKGTKKHKTVAFCGTRGLPATYGGFETAVDEISRRFVESNYDCEVFCRLSSGAKLVENHEGRRLAYVRGSNNRKLETFISSIQTGWYIWQRRQEYDFIFWFNNANFPGILMTRLARIPMAVNVDGLEWRRAKWSWPFKAYYILTSFLISRFCKNLIADSRAIQTYYRKKFFKKTSFIPYGAGESRSVNESRRQSVLAQYGLEEGRYFLQITRLEPDNIPLEIALGFKESGLDQAGFKMVLVGYKEKTSYTEQIKALSGKTGVEVLEAVYDPEVLAILRQGCFCYIHGNSVGGTNPALLEAMAACRLIMAVDNAFSREVLGDERNFFKPNEIRASLKKTVDLADQSKSMRQRLVRKYDWREVAKSYMLLSEGKSPNNLERP